MLDGMGLIDWTAVAFEEVPPAAQPKARLAEVVSVICAGEGVTSAEIFSVAKPKRIAKPRLMAYSLARELTGLSYPALGRLFRRDHSSLLYGCRAVDEQIASDPQFAEKMAGYRAQVCAAATDRIINTHAMQITALQQQGPSLRWAERNKLPRSAELPT